MHRRALHSALLLFTVSLSLPGAASASGVIPLSYVLDVTVRPEAGSLDARGTVRVRVPAGSTGLTFSLHDTFAIRRLRLGADELPFTTTPNAPTRLRPASMLVSTTLPAEHPEVIELTIEYGGRFHQLPQSGTDASERLGYGLDDAIESSRVELASYSAWYPSFAEYGARFAHDLTIRMPAGWVVVASGEKGTGAQGAGEATTSRWRATDALDIVCVASPHFQVHRVEAGGAAVELYATRLPRAFLEREADAIRRSLELCSRLLGHPRVRLATVRSVFAPREAGQGGYSRSPLLVTSEGRMAAAVQKDPTLSTLRGVAHEAGHFWWSLASGQADWLNEAFAEYFSYVALEQLVSRERSAAAVASAQRAVKELPADAPSLATVPASNDGDLYTVRYYKGALMLHAFRQALGDEGFFRACRDFYRAFAAAGATTESARVFWRARLGARASLVDAWFDAPGAQVPEPR